jgi:hypothetical protein
MDADGQHSPGDIGKLLEQILPRPVVGARTRGTGARTGPGQRLLQPLC